MATMRGQAEIERLVSDACRQVLGVERLDRDDNLLDLGGYSLIMMQIATRIHADHGVALPLDELLGGTSVAKLAKQVTDLLAAQAFAGAGPVRNPGRESHPLSFAQERVWFLSELVPGNVAYQSQCAVYLDGPLDRETLRRTWTEMVRRHEVLRTTFGKHPHDRDLRASYPR